MMTAMWASPIVRRTCSPVALRSRRTVGSSSSIRGERRAHLVEVALALRLDGDHQRRLGEVERRQDERLLARRERVAGLGHGQLRDRADLAGLELADRLLLLAVEQQQLADPLVLARGSLFQTCACEWSVPGQDAQVGQPADERVGGRLEHADEERAVLVGGDLDRRAGLVGRPRPAPRRRGRGGSGRSRRAAPRRPMPLIALPTRTGARIDSLTPLRRHASSSGSEISSPSRYLVRTSSSASAAASSSWSRRRRDLVGQLVGDRDLDLARAVPAARPCGGRGRRSPRTSRPRRSRAGAARSCCRSSPAARRAPRVGSAFSRSHLLMKKHAAVPVARPSATAVLEAGLDAARGVHHEERAVGRGEALDDVGDEVRVAGRVDQRDPRPVATRTSRPRGSATRGASAPRARSRGGPSRRRRGRAGGSPRP